MIYIYDNSFNFFQSDFSQLQKKENPIIFGYVPKLYYEDCYKCYNGLIIQLKLNKEKIDLSNKKVFKKRRELEKKIYLLRQQYEKLLKSS